MILIIDAEKDADIKVTRYFYDLGIRAIQHAKNVAQARSIIEDEEKSGKTKITLIVINADFEDGDGYELCRDIRESNVGKNAFILMLVSSAENKTAIEKAKRFGANDFAVKPYQSTGFEHHLEKYLTTKVVLLIEDDPLTRKIVCKYLSKYQLEVIEADDGIEAYNLINSMLPVSLVIMDIGLPNMNGIKLLNQIKSKPVWRKVPVVMLTASTDVSDVKISLSAGAKDYIVKPFKIDDFAQRVSRFIVKSETKKPGTG